MLIKKIQTLEMQRMEVKCAIIPHPVAITSVRCPDLQDFFLVCSKGHMSKQNVGSQASLLGYRPRPCPQ